MVKDNGIELFLDDLANRKPTPSGGSAAAVMGAIGAALVSMVCNLTIGKTQYRDFEEELKSVLTKAEELRRDCGIADRFERQPCFVERLLQHHERLRIGSCCGRCALLQPQPDDVCDSRKPRRKLGQVCDIDAHDIAGSGKFRIHTGSSCFANPDQSAMPASARPSRTSMPEVTLIDAI